MIYQLINTTIWWLDINIAGSLQAVCSNDEQRVRRFTGCISTNLMVDNWRAICYSEGHQAEMGN